MSVRIGLGVATQPFSRPRELFRWADLCEDSAIDSVWQSDRLVGEEPYLEAMSAMAALAGATTRLKFGMNAVVVSARDPLLLAKQCATVDHLSDGRLLPVFGVGNANAAEWAAMGRSPKGRGRRADEALEIMQRLWRGETVDFAGEHFQCRGARIAPLPKQQPLPLWIGGASPAAIRRTARIGTGWLGGLQNPAEVGPTIEAIRREAAAGGREIPSDHFGATFPFRLGSEDDAPASGFARILKRAGGPAQDWLSIGGPEDVIRRCRQYRDAGVQKFVLIPLAQGDDDMMEQTRRLAAEVLPVVHAWD
jgi:probable F420-dependent oxidoreductase